MTYTVQANLVDNISPALGKIQTQLNSTTSAFGKLKTALAGIAFGALIKDALAYADAVADLSDATGVAIQNIVGFQKAVQGAGGSTEGAQKGILKLVNSIGDAASGSSEMQDAFAQVGVTLEDLRTLSEQDILRKTVAGLAKINDNSTQSILKTALLGKEFRNVSAAKLDESLDKATAASAKYAESIKKAAEAQDQFDRAAGAVKMALIDLISPMTAFLGALPGDKLDQFIGGMVKLAAVVAVVYGWFKLLAVATAAAAEMGAFVVGIVAFATGIGEALAAITLLIAGIYAVGKGIQLAFDVNPVDWFIEKVRNAYRAVREFLGLPRISVDSGAGAGRGGNDATTKALQDQGEAMRKQVEEQRKVVDAFNKQRLAIQQVTEDFNKQNKAIIDNINLDNSLIGASLEVVDVTRAQEEIFKRAADAADKLRDSKDKLSEADKRAGLGGIIDGQIKKIQELAAVEAERVKRAVENSQKLMSIRKLEEFGTQNRIKLEDELMRIQDDIATGSMSEIEKKYYDIKKAADISALAAIRAEEARVGRRLDINEVKKYYEESAKYTKILTDEEQRAYDKSRQFSTGWAKAFKDYADNATNAAKAAERIFSKAMSGMEDLLVNFAKTGKFEWKNFVSMMLEELLRSQIQSTFASILKGMSGSMSGGGGLGGLFSGLLGGGGSTAGQNPNDPLYVADVTGGMGGGGLGGGITGGVGEGSGGGMFSGITGTLGKAWEGIKGIGSAIGGGLGSAWEGIKSIGSSISNGIGSIFGGSSSGGGGISDLFSGFFANGGTIPGGKFGVVGEAGPEFVSGPATVTPMGGGTNVTYNINAVDAMSFKQMLAQDPSFIYALSLQGSNGVAARR